MPCRVDALRMPLKLGTADVACPDVLVGDGVAVFCSDVDVLVRKEGGCFHSPVKTGSEGLEDLGPLQIHCKQAREVTGAYHCWKDFPCGLSLTLLTMKFAKWQNSCARTFRRRSMLHG